MHTNSDHALARQVTLAPIEAVAARAGLPEAALYRHGPHKAKLALAELASLPPNPRARLVLVTAISPTPAGEGKTTTTIGLGDALNRIGRKTLICLREPSLGPCFGMKGGATGGGRAQIAPADEINLHLTGDFHAITTANNLLAALIDNHIHWGNALRLDPGRVTWRRALDMNDRTLRQIAIGLGGNGPVREDGFDITAASEVMAILCLARSLPDLEQRLERIVVGADYARQPITAGALGAATAMAALLRDALNPNLVQTLEGNPAFVHGGPFANIAHGCNSLAATTSALKLADYVVTEAGFGADLGAEKFLDIKCRIGDLAPAAAVIVATARALKMHGGVAKAALAQENPEAVRRGCANLGRHIENMRAFGLPVLVAINGFVSDTPAETDAIVAYCAALGVTALPCRHWAEGGAGAEALAEAVVAACDQTTHFTPLYPDAMPLAEKIRTIAHRIYRAREVEFSPAAEKRLRAIEAGGHGNLPVCMAKTQYSFSADPTLLGAPENFTLPVREIRLSAGAGFVVALCGEIMTMPGLPRDPAALQIHLNRDGAIEGLI